jgi:hypothetical protein
MSRLHGLSKARWLDALTRIAMLSNRECEARLPIMLLRTILFTPREEEAAAAALVSAGARAGLWGQAQLPSDYKAKCAPILDEVVASASSTFNNEELVASTANIVVDGKKLSKALRSQALQSIAQIEQLVFFAHDAAPRSNRGEHAVSPCPRRPPRGSS